jgi:hypothetical protein
LYFFKAQLVEDGFYVVVNLFSITIPLYFDDLPAFIHDTWKLFYIRNMLINECILNNNNNTSNWKRDTLETPLLDTVFEHNCNNRPMSNKRRRKDNDSD